MRAIIETGGKQFAVAPNQTIRVPSLAGDPGDEVTFERVLYAAGDDAVHHQAMPEGAVRSAQHSLRPAGDRTRAATGQCQQAHHTRDRCELRQHLAVRG